MRFKKLLFILCGFCIAVTQPVASWAQSDADQLLLLDQELLLEQYLTEIESLISANDLEGARDKLAEAQTANLRDESLEIVQSQLRLLESLNQSGIPATDLPSVDFNGPAIAAASAAVLTETDKTAATDLLDSLRVAMENGELEKVRFFTDTTPATDSLLTAVFNNYAAMRVELSAPEPDEESESFVATLTFKEFTTKNGDTAFPAQAWETHRLRVVKSDGNWQKVLW